MEVSKPLQADIRNIQNQLKIAIQNHQLVLLKMRDDPSSNMQMKKQLLAVQKHILFLGESQKQLVQRLRKELEANSTNSKNVALPTRPSSVSSTSSSTTSEDSEDSQRDRDEVVAKCCSGVGRDPSLATKLQFMSAVGLVTREVLSELQNRRVERKRRSTANHTQFVYGNSWDVSKRKKSNYLTTGIPPPTRQVTRSVRIEPADSVAVALRIPGLPPSLTIERIPTTVCVVCRKPGSLSICSGCKADYHLGCAGDRGKCPQCNVKQEQNLDMKERELEKQRLLSRNSQLNNEKDTLETRAAELSAALVTQTANRKELLNAEESTRKSIQRLNDFVTIIKSARTPPPPS